MDASKLNGWQRLGAFVSVIWIIGAGALYLSVIGNFVFYSHSGRWILLWDTLNPLASFVPLFANGGAPKMPEFDFFGFALFVAFPVLVIWALGYGIAWVRKGFISDKDKTAQP